MSWRRTTSIVAASTVAGSGLLLTGSANAEAAQVSLTFSRRVVVNYAEGECVTAEMTWQGRGAGVTKVVMDQWDQKGRFVYRETAPAGQARGLGAGCSSEISYGKWTIRVRAFNKAGRVLAHTSGAYYYKGNTKITEFNASPEPVRRGAAITVKGRLLAFTYDPAPARHRSYPSKAVRVYFRAKGSATWKYAGSTTTGKDGRFRKRFTAKQDGTWRAYFPGTSRFVSKASADDFVDVR